MQTNVTDTTNITCQTQESIFGVKIKVCAKESVLMLTVKGSGQIPFSA